ncbi:MAG: hypothetical protein K0R07_1848, partial [Sedimentibacter sp.]|nr:hypothetical protein [Sedimentibacter sp.]
MSIYKNISMQQTPVVFNPILD